MKNRSPLYRLMSTVTPGVTVNFYVGLSFLLRFLKINLHCGVLVAKHKLPLLH